MQKGGGVWPRGLWLKQAEEQEPGNLDMQIASLLDSINVQNEVWTDLARRFRVDVFCGLFIAEANEGISLSAETLRRLADRSLTIDFDIYANARDPNDD